MSVPDRCSRFVEDRHGKWHWRQVLDWLDAHIVDHGGSLWIWQPDGDYKWLPEGCMGWETIFYDMSDIYEPR